MQQTENQIDLVIVIIAVNTIHNIMKIYFLLLFFFCRCYCLIQMLGNS